MPRITKAHMKESIVLFANDAVKVINEYLDLDDNKDNINRFNEIEHDGWYYILVKNVQHVNPEIRIERRNHKIGNEKELPKGTRICERAWIYKEGMNCKIIGVYGIGDYEHAPDHGYLFQGFSIQDYSKCAF